MSGGTAATTAGTVDGLPPELLGSRAAQALGSVPGGVRVRDMYDPAGARFYHDFTAADVSEVREILREVRETSGAVLELAAGAGRLTLPLLGLRRPVTAVDLSPSMLELLRERLAGLPASAAARCTTVQADITAYASPEPVGVTVLGTTSVSLLDAEQRRSMLARTRDNLVDGGSLVMTTVELASGATDLADRVLQVTGSTGVRYEVHDVVAPDRLGRHTLVVPPASETPPTPRAVAHSYIRMVPLAELAEDLRYAGFEMRTVPLTPEDRYTSTLVHATKRG